MSEDTMEPGEDDTGTDGGGIEELLAGIPDMAQRLATTEETVADLVAVLSNYPAGGPWLWEALEPAAQRDLWVELDAFVVWLQNRILCHHASRERWIPECWYKHPDAVEQLTALMVAHKASYHPKAKTPSHALVDWFQKCLWPTMDTLRERLTLKECQTERAHVEPYMPGEKLVANDSAFAAFVDATVPEPDPENNDADGEVPPWSVDRATGEVTEPPTGDEPPEPEDGGRHG